MLKLHALRILAFIKESLQDKIKIKTQNQNQNQNYLFHYSNSLHLRPIHQITHAYGIHAYAWFRGPLRHHLKNGP